MKKKIILSHLSMAPSYKDHELIRDLGLNFQIAMY